jgi:hypothetical protein
MRRRGLIAVIGGASGSMAAQGARSSRWWVISCLYGWRKRHVLRRPIHETNDRAPLNGDFRLLPAAANSLGAAVWTLGVTAYVQRRVRTSPSDSLALYVVPNATYLPSADWVISLRLKTWERWYQGVPARPISRRDFEINPVLIIAYDPSTLFGGDSPLGSPQIALEIGFDTRSSNLVNKSFKQWTAGPVLSAKWKF